MHNHAATAALNAGDASLMPSKSPSKSELRQLWRCSFPAPEARRKASREICTALAKSLESIDGSIMAFLAMRDEPDLDALMSSWLHESRTVLAPLVQWAEGTMAPAKLRAPLPKVNPNPKAKPREPNGVVMPQSSPAVVLIPGVAFTAEGSRLGRGGGFYDRFLRTLPKSTLRIGVCFSAQIKQVLPTERHDEPVSFLLTETGWIGSPPCQEQP